MTSGTKKQMDEQPNFKIYKFGVNMESNAVHSKQRSDFTLHALNQDGNEQAVSCLQQLIHRCKTKRIQPIYWQIISDPAMPLTICKDYDEANTLNTERGNTGLIVPVFV